MGTVMWLPTGLPQNTVCADALQWGPSDLDPNADAFSDALLVQSTTALKTLFDAVDPRRVSAAARDTNPLEGLGCGDGLNRCGLKLAELLQAVASPFGPQSVSGAHKAAHTGRPTFVDLCAAPGGFSQHLMTRCPDARGWGFSLRDPKCDWRVDRVGGTVGDALRCGLTILFGDDDTGDITVNGNVRSLSRAVRRGAAGGVDLVTADGGASVGVEYNRQEYHLRRLILGEVAAALCVLARGGAFVCKMFDMRSRFTVSLVALLCSCFGRVGVLKPWQSRPANAERYVVCTGFCADAAYVDAVVAHLFATNTTLSRLGCPAPAMRAGAAPATPIAKDIVGLVPVAPALQTAVRLCNARLEQLAVTFLERTVTVLGDPGTLPGFAAHTPGAADLDALRARLLQ
jgi:cap1 methyltransferase